MCIYLSVWLLVEKERDGKVIWRFRALLGLRWRGSDRLRVMNGNHAGGLEFREVKAEFVLHPGKCGCSQAVASEVVGVDGRKLRDAGLGCGLRSCRTTADRKEKGMVNTQI